MFQLEGDKIVTSISVCYDKKELQRIFRSVLYVGPTNLCEAGTLFLLRDIAQILI